MTEPRYTITLTDLTINDCLILGEECFRKTYERGSGVLPVKIQKQLDRQLKKDIWPRHEKWSQEEYERRKREREARKAALVENSPGSR